MTRPPFAVSALLSCSFLPMNVASAAEPNCRLLEQFLLGQNAKRLRHFQRDGGRVDVVVYFQQGNHKRARILEIPPNCTIHQARFHTSLNSLMPGTLGVRVHIWDEASQYRVMVKLTELRPLTSEPNDIPFAATDLDKFQKKDLPQLLFDSMEKR